MKLFNLKKIKKMITNWKIIFVEKNEKEALKKIKNQIQSKNMKFIWTINEMEQAINKTLIFLDSI